MSQGSGELQDLHRELILDHSRSARLAWHALHAALINGTLPATTE